jgi:hypothetical protein
VKSKKRKFSAAGLSAMRETARKCRVAYQLAHSGHDRCRHVYHQNRREDQKQRWRCMARERKLRDVLPAGEQLREGTETALADACLPACCDRPK